MSNRIKILCVGKIREPYFREGIRFYQEQLSSKYQTEIIECPDEPAPDHISAREKDQILQIEGERILKKITRDDRVIALCIEGKTFTTSQLRDRLRNLACPTSGSYCFIIGGSLGLSPAVVSRADLKVSFSSMTFPHQMMRLILLEQLTKVM